MKTDRVIGDTIERDAGRVLGITSVAVDEVAGIVDLGILLVDPNKDEKIGKIVNGVKEIADQISEGDYSVLEGASSDVGDAIAAKYEELIEAIASGNHFNIGRFEGELIGLTLSILVPVTKVARAANTLEGLSDVITAANRRRDGAANDNHVPINPRQPDIPNTSRQVGGCSFSGDTLVATSNGYEEIRNIRAGMSVFSRDAETGETGYKSVRAHFSDPYEETVNIVLRDADTGAEQTIVSNRVHPIFVSVPESVATPPSSEGHFYNGAITGGRWIDADDLKPGFKLLGEDTSWSEVVSIEITPEPLTAYNITVDGWHTYFVKGELGTGLDAIWVHNTCNRDDLLAPRRDGRPGGAQLDNKTIIGANGNRYTRNDDGTYTNRGTATLAEVRDSGVNLHQTIFNRVQGHEFENALLDALGIGGNNSVISVTLPDGRVVNTIPDALGRGAGGVTEAKDALAPRYRGQIETQIQHAMNTNQPFNLVVSPRTRRIPLKIREAAMESKGGIFIFDPISGTLTPWI